LGCALPSSFGSAERVPERIALSDGWLAMGTFFEVDLRVAPEDVEGAKAWLEWSRGEIERLEQIYSRHDPDSALSVLNRELSRSDALRETIEIRSELETILFDAIEVWTGSGGAFDPTIGPLVDVWTLAAARGSFPALEDLRQAKRSVGSGSLLLLGDGELGLAAEGMRIDLDGISKGAVLDRLRGHLVDRLPDAAALMSFGQSSILALGDPEEAKGEPDPGWLLEIRSRSPQAGILGRVRLHDQALSVSSSVGSVSEIAGEVISQVVDPRTGATVEGTVEAVVIADRAALADGWSTALLVLGADREAIRLVEKAGLEAMIFRKAGRSVVSAGWEALNRSEQP
jgi:thiamine biosynthesis lipoprotein